VPAARGIAAWKRLDGHQCEEVCLMSKIRELPQSEWEKELSRISAEYQGHPVDVNVESPDIGRVPVVESRPLIAIEPDPAPRGAGFRSMDVVVGDQSGANPQGYRHLVVGPQRVCVAESDAGRLEWLEVDGEGGKTVVKLAA